MSKPVLFWREGYDRGMSGHYVRERALNTVIPQWIAEGIEVVAVLFDPKNGDNVDVLIHQPAEPTDADA